MNVEQPLIIEAYEPNLEIWEEFEEFIEIAEIILSDNDDNFP